MLNADDWEALIEWIETLENVGIATQALAELKAAGGESQTSGLVEMGRGRKRAEVSGYKVYITPRNSRRNCSTLTEFRMS